MNSTTFVDIQILFVSDLSLFIHGKEKRPLVRCIQPAFRQHKQLLNINAAVSTRFKDLKEDEYFYTKM